MSTWPPPPDLASIKELVRDADTEEFIGLTGASADEYDGEAEELFTVIGGWPTSQINPSDLLPTIEKIWSRSFDYDDQVLASIRPKLEALAQRIARFFGPEAQPQVRTKT